MGRNETDRLKEIHKMFKDAQAELERTQCVQTEQIPVFELLRQDAETLYYLARVLEQKENEK